MRIYVCVHMYSPYYSNVSFSCIQELCITNPNDNVLIIIDFNARIGPLKNSHLALKYNLNYSENPNCIVNSHGKTLLQLDEDNNMIPKNHLNRNILKADGGYTYRQGEPWVSRLDWAFCSVNGLDLIQDFEISHDSKMVSNHAPIMLEVSVSFCTSNSILDRSKTLLRVDDSNQNPATKCIKANNIDKAKFRSFLPHPMAMVGWENGEIDIESVCYSLSCCMYETSKKAEIVRSQSVANVNRASRWQLMANE